MSESTRTRVVVLGSTGSIGRQAIDVIRSYPDRFTVVGLVAGSDAKTLEQQATALDVGRTGLGREAAVAMAGLDDADVVLNAVVGAAGLEASVTALRAGKRLALANKESLVAGGEVCLAAADEGGGSIVPVDSEHAAIAQCLEAAVPGTVEGISLTASGGPFRERPDLSDVTVSEALQHPTWTMGPKITIDSATLMNKGLEVLEAHYLFGFGFDQIRTVVHPQSLIHGMVHLRDGSTLMQAATADMRIPIASALSYPDRLGTGYERIDLTAAGTLEFLEPDVERFPALGLAYTAGRAGASYPAALNAANEVAVEAFLQGRISFTAIADTVAAVLDAHESRDVSVLSSVFEVDAQARASAGAVVDRLAGAAPASKVGA